MKRWHNYCAGLAALAGLAPLAQAQSFPGIPSPTPLPPVAAAAATAAPVAPAAPASNLWSFLCPTPEQKQACREKICQSQLGLLLNNTLAPVSFISGGILPRLCPGLPTAQELADQGPVGAAAKIKKMEAEAKARAAAVRYLGTVPCYYYPEAQDALVAALRKDPNECVRWEAAKALGNGCCCTRKTMAALAIVVSGSDKDGDPGEISERVKNAAEAALYHCLACYTEVAPAPKKTEAKPEGGSRPEGVPAPKPEPAPSGNTTAASGEFHIQLAAYYKRVDSLPMAEVVDGARRVLTETRNATSTPAASYMQPGSRGLWDIVAYAADAPRMVSATAPSVGGAPPAKTANPTEPPLMTQQPKEPEPPTDLYHLLMSRRKAAVEAQRDVVVPPPDPNPYATIPEPAPVPSPVVKEAVPDKSQATKAPVKTKRTFFAETFAPKKPLVADSDMPRDKISLGSVSSQSPIQVEQAAAKVETGDKSEPAKVAPAVPQHPVPPFTPYTRPNPAPMDQSGQQARPAPAPMAIPPVTMNPYPSSDGISAPTAVPAPLGQPASANPYPMLNGSLSSPAASSQLAPPSAASPYPVLSRSQPSAHTQVTMAPPVKANPYSGTSGFQSPTLNLTPVGTVTANPYGVITSAQTLEPAQPPAANPAPVKAYAMVNPAPAPALAQPAKAPLVAGNSNSLGDGRQTTVQVQPGNVKPAPSAFAAAGGTPAMSTPGLPSAPSLLRILKDSYDPFQREWAADKLSAVSWAVDEDVAAALVKTARADASAAVRVHCIRTLTLRHVNTPQVIGAIKDLKTDADPRVQHEADLALMRLGTNKATITGLSFQPGAVPIPGRSN